MQATIAQPHRALAAYAAQQRHTNERSIARAAERSGGPAPTYKVTLGPVLKADWRR